MKLILEPTARLETLGGITFRVYEGQTNDGTKLEMLGLFRIRDSAEKRAQFERAVCAVKPTDPAPVRLLSEAGLVRP